MSICNCSLLRNVIAVAALALCLAGLSGCGVGPASGTSVGVESAPPISGILHGGPNPIIGARVVIYSTTTSGYGAAANALQEATQVGASLHQDTDSSGNFSFAGGYTCPAGQFAYIVAYGGKTGSAAVNPNSILMAALGRCDDLYTGTTYSGSYIIVNELTTVAAAYALSNFITITGNAVSGYAVAVSSDAANGAQTGCVANAYYQSLMTCPTTVAAGLRHAFANAVALVNTNTGAANSTLNGGVIPVQLINTLGNILQFCVNSTGGGTDGSGAPTTAVSATSGVTWDGTNCGQLFAMTSYTSNGLLSGTLTTAGNTLQAMMNLAKRPAGITNGTSSSNGSGQFSAFNSCTTSGSNYSGGAIVTSGSSAPTCIFNMASGISFYSPAMSAAPYDWTLSITWPKYSFFPTTTNSATCGSSVQTYVGLGYAYALATDINDDIIILNEDAGTSTCYNLLSITNAGAAIGYNTFDSSTVAPVWVSTDSYGHAIVAAKGANAVRVYAAGSSDSTISLVQTIAGNATVASATNGTNSLIAASTPYFTSVDSTGNILVTAENSTNDIGFASVTTQSHTAPSYTGSNIYKSGTTLINAKMASSAVDINNNFVTPTYSSTAGSPKDYLIVAGGAASTNFETSTAFTGAFASNPYNGSVYFDTSGNIFTLLNWTTGTSPCNCFEVYQNTYTTSSGAATGISATPTVAASLFPAATSPTIGAIDGANVIWFGDNIGSYSATPVAGVNYSYIRSYDTVHTYGSPQLYGCSFLSSNSSYTTCGGGSGATSSSQIYPFYGVYNIAVDASGNLWVASARNYSLTEVIGMATPTWPLFIHNGSSTKP